MRFFIIPPISALGLTQKGTGGLFALAHLYVKYAEYRRYVHARKAAGDFIIMDNGAAEHSLVDENTLLQIAVELQPDEIIAPDVLFDGINTIRNLESFAQGLKQVFSSPRRNPPNIFAVPQGRNRVEWIFVYEYLLAHPDVATIGFSKIAIPKAYLGATNDESIKEARWMAYDDLNARGLIQKPIHLLGLGDPRELLYYKNDPLIRSNDSCNAVWSGMCEIEWKQGNYKRVPTPHDYFERQMTDLTIMMAIENANWLKDQL